MLTRYPFVLIVAAQIIPSSKQVKDKEARTNIIILFNLPACPLSLLSIPHILSNARRDREQAFIVKWDDYFWPSPLGSLWKAV
jgi:hypothetical protein